MSLHRSLCDSLVLKDDKSSVKVADFNDPSMRMYAAILNRLWSVSSGYTRFCQIFVGTAHHTAFGSDMGAAILGYRLPGGVCL